MVLALIHPADSATSDRDRRWCEAVARVNVCVCHSVGADDQEVRCTAKFAMIGAPERRSHSSDVWDVAQAPRGFAILQWRGGECLIGLTLLHVRSEMASLHSIRV